MHSILKDGNYIQYGPKIIPNPNAEGGGGSGEGIKTVNVEVQFRANDEIIAANLFAIGNFLTDYDEFRDVFGLVYGFNNQESAVLKCYLYGTFIRLNTNSEILIEAYDEDGNYYIIDDEEPIYSVSGDCEKLSALDADIWGDCVITFNMILD